MSAPTMFVTDTGRDYGTKVAAVEPGGVEFIPLDERHGSPIQLLWTWAVPPTSSSRPCSSA